MARKNEAPEDQDEKLGGDVEDGGKVKIDLQEPDVEPDDDDKGQTAAGERVRDPETGKWAAKKTERKNDHREKKAWEREREDYDRRIQRMQEDQDRRQQESDRRFAELRQEVERTRQGGGGGDPYIAKLQDINKQIAAELKVIEADESRGYDRYQELQEHKAAIVAERTYARLRAEDQRNQPAPQQQNPYAYRVPIIESEYPWINDPRFRDIAEKAKIIKHSLVGLEGRPDTIDTDREALSTAVARYGAEYGLRAPAPPSQRTRSLYASPGSNTGPSRGREAQEIEVPRQLLNGTRLNESALRGALRDVGDE
jgi:hypothetical protein